MYHNMIFRNFNPLFYRMIHCMDQVKSNTKKSDTDMQAVISELIDYCGGKGYQGNLWKAFLAEEIVYNENMYALACERRGQVTGNINEMVLLDIKNIYELFHFDLRIFEEKCLIQGIACIDNFQMETKKKNEQNVKAIMKFVNNLNQAKSPKEMKQVIEAFYQGQGVGDFALYHAFRFNDHQGNGDMFERIEHIESIRLDDLVGYDIPKQKLVDNTEAFLAGKPANNCLLFGDAGTGKSSSIKAILNAYAGQGLRIIEIYKYQFTKLNEIIKALENRNYKFIIYMDDLSFENFETEYKYLKAIIEGGLAKKPENILIYATSNRRHLIRENYSDREEIREDMHASETVQEKLSLVARFGVSIFFCRPDRKEFQKIVTTLAKRYHVQIAEEELLFKANQWELSHGGLSGRTAKQFIDYIRGGIEDE